MVRNVLLLFIVLYCKICAGQEKPDDAIVFSTTVTGEFITNFSGGIKKGYTYVGKEELTLGFNTEKGKWWRNGFFFVHGLNTHGNGPSANLTGDLQILSNLEAGDHTGLFEFWYSHQLGKFTFLLGQHDMNTEFLGSKYSSIFVNSSFGIMPSISLNMPISIFPMASPGFVIKYESEKNIIYRLGVYDGNPGNFENNRFNLHWSISADEGFFTIGEIEHVQKDGDVEIGDYKIGSYYHTGQFKSYTDTLKSIKGNYGFYVLIDKALFPRSFSAAHGLCIFIQSGITSPKCNMVHYYIGGGFRFHGILPNRFQDHLGIAFAHISLSKNYVNYATESVLSETTIETTYAFHFGGRYCIQPSMQYVVNPGSNKNLNNSFVGLLRFSLTY